MMTIYNYFYIIDRNESHILLKRSTATHDMDLISIGFIGDEDIIVIERFNDSFDNKIKIITQNKVLRILERYDRNLGQLKGKFKDEDYGYNEPYIRQKIFEALVFGFKINLDPKQEDNYTIYIRENLNSRCLHAGICVANKSDQEICLWYPNKETFETELYENYDGLGLIQFDTNSNEYVLGYEDQNNEFTPLYDFEEEDF
jgi:hypothetical protein